MVLPPLDSLFGSDPYHVSKRHKPSTDPGQNSKSFIMYWRNEWINLKSRSVSRTDISFIRKRGIDHSDTQPNARSFYRRHNSEMLFAERYLSITEIVEV